MAALFMVTSKGQVTVTAHAGELSAVVKRMLEDHPNELRPVGTEVTIKRTS